jgi:predicted 3-demethylubiquinone-9 3-methyltransferase (glyoxalase superfamily)
MSAITTCLWFDGKAEEAANFYVKVFTEGGRKASLGRIARYGEAVAKVSGQPKGSAMTVEFDLDGNTFLGLNGGAMFKFSMATSFIISCKNQKEIDYFWAALSEGGEEGQCGWINRDKFGISWQIVPDMMGDIAANPDPAKAEAAMKAMLSMKKLDIAALKAAGV